MMAIKQRGGVFGRHPEFKTADVEGQLTAGSLDVEGAGQVDGPLLVGTGTAEAGLHVDQNVSGLFARFKRLSSQYLDLLMTSGVTQLYAYGKTFQVGTGSDHEVIIRQNNFSRMTFETNGDVTVENGNLIIGTSGKGIDFSATAGAGTSELFDDYEEGTWTPTYVPATGAFDAITYNVQEGYYTKIGNMVNARLFMRIATLTKGAASGAVNIVGLPYAAANTRTIGTVWSTDFLVSNPSYCQPAGSQLFLFYRSTANGSSNNRIDVTDLNTFSTDNSVILSVNYQTA